MKTSYNSTCPLRVLIQWTEQFFSHKLVRPCGAVLADRCFCLSTCWLAFQFCWPLCCHTQSRSAAATLNPNQGKEQFIQTTFPPPPLYTAATPWAVQGSMGPPGTQLAEKSVLKRADILWNWKKITSSNLFSSRFWQAFWSCHPSTQAPEFVLPYFQPC